MNINIKNYVKLCTALFLSVLVLVSYQNCSNPVGFTNTATPLGSFGSCDFGCFDSNIDPVVNESRPEIKVLFVVDNSNTMSLSQQYLSNGVANLMQNLRGFNASFYVHTTTDQGDKQVLGSPVSRCSWIENGVAMTGATCPNNQPILYSSESVNTIARSLNPSNQPLRILANQSQAEFNLVQQNVVSAILSSGTNGSATETGLCTLNRVIYDEGPNKVFAPGDIGAIVLISDEDDSSSPSTCKSKTLTSTKWRGRAATQQACVAGQTCDNYNYRVNFLRPYTERQVEYKCNEWKEVNCSSNCSKYNYTMSFADTFSYKSRAAFQCKRFNDGVEIAPGAVTNGTALVDSSCSTDGAVIGACSAAQVTEAQNSCGTSGVFGCQSKCVRVTNPRPANVTYSDASGSANNFCSSAVTINNQNYASLVNYAQTVRGTSAAVTCSRQGRSYGFVASGLKYMTPVRTTSCSTQVLSQEIASAEASCVSTNPQNQLLANSVVARCNAKNDSANCDVNAVVDNGTNFCNATFTAGASTYSNITNYCLAQSTYSSYTSANGWASSCARNPGRITVQPSGLDVESTTSEEFTYPTNVRTSDAVDLKSSFISKANSTFGNNGYFVSAIIRDVNADAASNCQPLQGNQSYGTKYRDLVSLIDNDNTANVSSICHSDYSASLSEVEEFITRTAETRYRATDVNSNQRIVKVWLEHKTTNQVVEMTMDSDVAINGPSIEILTQTAYDWREWRIFYRVENITEAIP